MGGTHALAHGFDFAAQGQRITRRGDDGFAHGVKTLVQVQIGDRLARQRREVAAAQHKAGAGHGLMFPGPCRVAAALLLVVGIGLETADQQAGVAVGAQGGVDLEEVALAGLDGQPVDELAHIGGIDLGGALIFVVKDENNVQIAAVAQLFAAQLAVAHDAKTWRVAVAVFQARPAPLGGDTQHAVGQCAQVVSHLLDGDAAFNVACQGAKHLGMVGTAQQIEQGFIVIFACGLQRSQAQGQFMLEVGGDKTLSENGVAGQLIHHAGVQLQIACGPAGRTQKV